MCSEAVLKYLQSTNRPYSVNDIFQNLHNAYSKNVIQKSLDELAEKGSVKEKVYGKQKVRNDTTLFFSSLSSFINSTGII